MGKKTDCGFEVSFKSMFVNDFYPFSIHIRRPDNITQQCLALVCPQMPDVYLLVVG